MGKTKKNKQVFLRPLSWKIDEAGRILFLFYISQKTNEATYFHRKLVRHCFVHFKYKNVDILILTYE